MLESFVVTLEMYRRAFSRGAILAAKNWPVLVSIFAYAGILSVGVTFAVLLGLAGGLLLSLLNAACMASFLYLVEQIVCSGKVSVADFRRSFGVYLWDVVGVSFVIWIFSMLTALIAQSTPNGAVIVLCINLVALVYFNAVPELIYLGHSGAVALLSRSYQFIAANWIEWFPPNLLLLGGLAAIWLLIPAHEPVLAVLRWAATALFLYFAMVVRGLLFIELDGSTRRARLFRHKMGR